MPGLSIKDHAVWRCKPLTREWRPRHVPFQFHDPISENASWGPHNEVGSRAQAGPSREQGEEVSGPPKPRWVWEYAGPESGAPTTRTMVEENMGPFEKHLQKISIGKDRKVLDTADQEKFSKFPMTHSK